MKGFRTGITFLGIRVLIERLNLWSSGASGIIVGGIDVEVRKCHVLDTRHVTSNVTGSISGIVANLVESVVIADCRVIDTNKAAGHQAIGISAITTEHS